MAEENRFSLFILFTFAIHTDTIADGTKFVFNTSSHVITVERETK